MENYTLRKLQAGYLKVTMRNVKEEESVCNLCWKPGCNCNSKGIKDDSFLNLTTISEFKYA